MGGAYTGLADGAESLYWNPAGLAFLQAEEVTATTGSAVFDLPEISLLGGFRVGESAGIAFSNFLTLIHSMQNTSGSTLPPWIAMESSIGGGVRRGPVGIGISFHRSSLWNSSDWRNAFASAEGFDVGTYGRSNLLGGSSAGFSVLGLAPGALPDLRAGMAARALASGRVTVAVDVRARHPWNHGYGGNRIGLSQYLPAANVGAEYRFALWHFACAARSGAQADYVRTSGPFNPKRNLRLYGPSLGLAAALPMRSYRATLSWAFLPESVLHFGSAWLSLTIAGNPQSISPAGLPTGAP